LLFMLIAHKKLFLSAARISYSSQD